MTLTLELPAEVEQVLAARAQARGVSLPEYLQDLAARDAQDEEMTPGSLETGEELATRLKDTAEVLTAEHQATVSAVVAAPYPPFKSPQPAEWTTSSHLPEAQSEATST